MDGSIHRFVDWGGDDDGGTQILVGSNQVPWSILGFVDWGGDDDGGTQILDGPTDTSWSILGVMEWDGAEEPKFHPPFHPHLEQPKFWMDPWTHHGRFLGLWGGMELRNRNFGWIHPWVCRLGWR